jgi:hypothetical protein
VLKPLHLIAALVLVAGCASTVEVPRNRLHPEAAYAQDEAECQEWAVMAPSHHHRPDGSEMSLGDWWRRCMRGRGWTAEIWEVNR